MTSPKTVLITGASSGSGLESENLFREKGWNVCATVRDLGRDYGLEPAVFTAELDVRNTDSIADALQSCAAHFGGIDLIINNAGYAQAGVLEELSEAKIKAQFDVNVFGVMNVMRLAMPLMRKRGSGMFINVSSGGGIYGVPSMSVYASSKFALEGFSEPVAYELASQNVVVKIVEPHGGVTNNNFNSRVVAEMSGGKVLREYDDFKKNMTAALSATSAAATISSRDVAETIFEAATDGTSRLRYLVGNDARGFLKAKKELPDQEYIGVIRRCFGLA